MMAYACCVKRRVASAGPLSDHNSAFDIRAVRERIEGDAETGRMRKRRDSCTAYDRAWREGEERRGQRRVRVLPPSHLVGKQGLGPPPGGW